MTAKSVVDRIRVFNRGREPERLALKYQAMSKSAFAFFRGTNHLFYEDWPRDAAWNDAPLAWITGDLHLENFGSFRGDNQLVYFDLNDFDNAVLAPVTWELARFLTSTYLAAHQYRIVQSVATRLCSRFLDRYREALRDGKARWVERSTSRGMVRDLLRGVRGRTREDQLELRTKLVHGRRLLRLHPRRVLPIRPSERKSLMRTLRDLGRGLPNPRFYRVMDIARRVAGTGSLGLRRYIVLVQGDGAPGGEVLLDLKEARPSDLTPYLSVRQPKWETWAARVVTIQRWVQAASPALLGTADLGGTAFVVRELQPMEDRLDVHASEGKLGRLEHAMETMAEVVAWGQLRSGGRQGSANTDSWVGFSSRTDWGKALLRYAQSYSKQVIRDWRSFRESGLG